MGEWRSIVGEHEGDEGFSPVVRGDETIAGIRSERGADTLRIEVVPVRSFGFLGTDVDGLIRRIREQVVASGASR